MFNYLDNKQIFYLKITTIRLSLNVSLIFHLDINIITEYFWSIW